MIICEKIHEKVFSDRTQKEAYLKCCKWVAKNAIKSKNAANISWRISKVEDRKVLLELFVCADEAILFERHCAICESRSIDRHEIKACDFCDIISYRNRLMDQLKRIKEVWKGIGK